MAEKGEGTAVRLIRFLALGVPLLSRIVAVALIAGALLLAFFDVGGYGEGERADLALLLSVLALVALATGYVVPRLVARFLPRR